MTFYAVDRIIARTKKGYLVKWHGYPKWACTFEPEENLNAVCLKALVEQPKPSDDRVQSSANKFLLEVQTKLSNPRRSNGLIKVDFDLDIFRWVFDNKGKPITKG
ncbi:uncharacterized protein LOC135386904 isoform X2 [Ornithodoros turicata]|uniref:uncharacterized protein LOC135386904 isoform X2 n=1 Tax=Ornithodoros turicata TaxID=34597 RepID=UPI0031392AF5